MGAAERSFSEFLRQPKEVVAELSRHDVVLRRRNAPALHLTQLDREASRAEAFVLLVRVLQELALENRAALQQAIHAAFAWITFLPAPDRDEFIDELTRTLAASSAIDNFDPVATLVNEWKTTAALYADPVLAERLGAPIETDGEPVPAPPV